MKKLLIFLVDNDEMHNQMLKEHLEEHYECEVKTYFTPTQCFENLQQNPDIVILDYDLQREDKNGMDTLDLLQHIKDKKEDTEVLLLSKEDKLQVSVDMMKYGAYDYIVKNEGAFIAAQNAVSNIAMMRHLDARARKSRMLNYILITVIVLAVIFCLLIFFFYPEVGAEETSVFDEL